MLPCDQITETTSFVEERQRLRAEIERALNAGDDVAAISLDVRLQALEEIIAQEVTLDRFN